MITRILFLSFWSYCLMGSTSLQVLIQRSRDLKLSDSEYWLRLLHMHKSDLRFESMAGNLLFFISGEEGKSNPQLELEKTLEAFAAEPSIQKLYEKKYSQPIACAFPARYAFLDSKLQISKLIPPQNCTTFMELKKTFRVVQ